MAIFIRYSLTRITKSIHNNNGENLLIPKNDLVLQIYINEYLQITKTGKKEKEASSPITKV